MTAPRIITPAQRAARKRERMGLGDAVGIIATPIAKVFNLDCIDPKTEDLRPESPCARRKRSLNQAGEKVTSFVSSILHIDVTEKS